MTEGPSPLSLRAQRRPRLRRGMPPRSGGLRYPGSRLAPRRRGGYHLAAMSDSGRPGAGAGDHPAWLLALAALLAWQAWLTLGLFGRDRPWERLLGDAPVLSGRHPLHLDHGHLGARARWERGTPSCYDPAFCAGYPKTPVFDGGSRPAEVALALVGARYSPAAYKVGHALLCASAPLLLFGAARGVGARRAAA